MPINRAKNDFDFIDHKNRFLQGFLQSAGIILMGVSFSGTSSAHMALANEIVPTSPILLTQSRPPRPDPGPSGSVSGATRGECEIENNSMLSTAYNDPYHLQPLSLGQIPFSYVESTSPQIWAYVPYVLDERSQIKLDIERTDTGDFVYESGRTTVHSPGGTIGLNIPISLEMGVNYTWHLGIYCDDLSPTASPQSISGQLEVVAAGERSLSERGFDSLTEQVLNYQLNPTNPAVQADWTATIEAAGLDEFPHIQVHTQITLPDVIN